MFYQVYSPNCKGMLMRTGAPPNYKQKYNLPKPTGQEDNARERQTSTTCNRTTSSWTEANKSLRRPNNQSQWACGQPTQRVHQPTLMDFYHQLLRQRATSLQEKISRSCVYKKKGGDRRYRSSRRQHSLHGWCIREPRCFSQQYHSQSNGEVKCALRVLHHTIPLGTS